MSSPRRSIVLVTSLVAACASPAATPGPASQSPTAAVPTTVPTVAAIPTSGPTIHPGEGVADPAGRIVFGRIVGEDDFYGSYVALWAIDPDGSDLIQLNDGGSGFPAISPDGRRIAFTQRQPDGTWQIATMAIDGTDVQVITSGAGADNAEWSPDGTWIAYQSFLGSLADETFHATLWRSNADGSDPEPLGDQEAFDVEPKISPDGTEVLFNRLTFTGDIQHQATIVRNLATGAERVLPIDGAEHVAWSPDGAWIVYDLSPNYTGRVESDQLERIASDGSGAPVVLYEGTGDSGAFKPTYSPDGTRIVFGCFAHNGSDRLCLIDHDGSNLVVLYDTPEHENHFTWGVSAGAN